MIFQSTQHFQKTQKHFAKAQHSQLNPIVFQKTQHYRRHNNIQTQHYFLS